MVVLNWQKRYVFLFDFFTFCLFVEPLPEAVASVLSEKGEKGKGEKAAINFFTFSLFPFFDFIARFAVSENQRSATAESS